MEFTIDKANEYIKTNRGTVNSFYRAKFHMETPVGWMNDPNGLIKFNNKYHLFYQFNPYDSCPGPMHWGHFISDDLIKYEHAEVALAPLVKEVGCFTGSAVVKDNKLHLIYTHHYEKDGFRQENQHIATSSDGLHFEVNEKPLVDLSSLDDDLSTCDFRDPAVFEIDGLYYMFVGGKLKTNEGVLLVFKSADLAHFEYDFKIGPRKEFGEMFECPDYFKINDKDVFLFSACAVKKEGNNYHNCNSSLYMIGKLDLINKTYEIENIKEIDKGDAFYAPKCIANNEQIIMIGWLEMWGKEYKTHVLNHGYAGAFSIPRVLEYKDGFLYQKIIDSLDKYIINQKLLNNGEIISRTSIVEFDIDSDFELIISSLDEQYDVKVYRKDGFIYLDTNNSNNLNALIRRSDYQYSYTNIQILLDSSSIELFIENGKESISSRVFLESEKYLVKYCNINNINYKEIEVNE